VSAKSEQVILLVEDEVPTRRAIHAMLANGGFAVLDAGDAQEALEILSTRPAPVDLLVTDLMLPTMKGLDLAGEAQALQPGLKVLYMTGNDQSVMAASLQASHALLLKPFGPRKLLAAVRKLLTDS
jgi:DNA-binding response OmpR family regulator